MNFKKITIAALFFFPMMTGAETALDSCESLAKTLWRGEFVYHYCI